MKKHIKNILLVAPIIILSIVMGICLMSNHQYNNKKRIGNITQDYLKDGKYDFGDISVEITIRGGDSGA